MSYRIDLKRGAVFLTATGRLTNDDLITCVAGLNADPDLMPGMPTLTDATGVTEMEVDLKGFRALTEVMDNSQTPRGESRAALLVTKHGDAMLGKLLMAISKAESSLPRYRVFDDRAAAESWLGIS
ncbi:MAG: hypothetical protein QF797_02845 [Alphaproteobacteria bacterium]|nr:hypothetical protein [Rhodospirillaceae bacterium]MDP6404123.1 hypothetical protein [Alphaproteobacteria bacterium]MDP6621895.1 hypothetical protein [Alphaproteobacteria bacterium]